MKYLVPFFFIAFLIQACSGGKNLTTSIQNGEAAYRMGKYEEAMKIYEEIIADYSKQDKANDCPVYTEAAATAIQVGNPAKAIEYLQKETYTSHVTELTYYQLADLYRDMNNLSKELEELETYVKKYPDGKHIDQVNARLFEVYYEIDEYDKALEMYSLLPLQMQEEPNFLEEYFLINKKVENDSVCDVVANQLLQIDEKNTLALEWEGEKYFWKAEKRYAAELKAYEANKTNKQYNKLLKALDVVSKDFKTSLGYFKKLFTIDPQKKYAKYLGDIYNRLDEKGKAKYYYDMIDGWE